MITELWTPPDVTAHSVSPVGRNAETGGAIEQHTFRVHDPVTDKKHKFVILADDETSQAHLEDMVSSAVDNWLREVRQKDHKTAPTLGQRKEIGKILDDIRIRRIKRKESSTGVINFTNLGGVLKNGRHRNNGNGEGSIRGSASKGK